MAQRNGKAKLISPSISFSVVAAHPMVVLGMGEDGSMKTWALLFGLMALAFGIMLMFRHQASYRDAFQQTDQERIRLFELRKYRRRMTASSMIAAIGVLLSALYWATEPKVFAILISLVLVSLLGVLGLACLDLFSVGLQELSKTDDSARQKLVAEYLRRREQQQAEEATDNAE